MSEELSLDQRIQLLASTDDVRLEYFVKTVKEHKTVWSLSNEEGFVMVETDDGDCVMVWPDADFAAQWAIDEWDDCEPVEVSLETFQSMWLPSLEKDNITLAVFPNIDDEGKLTSAEQLKALLG
ncbi:DUF2750 domain-containing protein [Marinomonas ostreistagni]|uniref:DUF2750 domain-containing protein n=1 Tax=Marinomonas ostreistagni TaxID=359209 RepID=A0ABS0ZC68_9GAMM|nr:DUF2750 domain-containing protein [Marinomonas ostreistagni]MBJ7551267.1 DUF2750 domain-containing protein [Marinomonas ostreistagni]